MSLSRVKDVTDQNEYRSELKRLDIRIFKSRNMLYVVKQNEILFKTISKYFEVIYAPMNGSFIFRIIPNQNFGSQVYEVMIDRIVHLEEISGFIDFYEAKDFPLIVGSNGDENFRIYNYERHQLLFAEKGEIHWLENARIFIAKKRFSDWYVITPKIEQNECVWEKNNSVSFTARPSDILTPQLVGNKVIQLGKGKVYSLQNFDSVKKVNWLPYPYEYIAKSKEDIYMLGCTKDVWLLDIDGDGIMPFAENFKGLENFLVVKKDKNIVIVQYDKEEDQLIKLRKFKGIKVELTEPELDLNAGCVKIPIKLISERYLNNEE